MCKPIIIYIKETSDYKIQFGVDFHLLDLWCVIIIVWNFGF